MRIPAVLWIDGGEERKVAGILDADDSGKPTRAVLEFFLKEIQVFTESIRLFSRPPPAFVCNHKKGAYLWSWVVDAVDRPKVAVITFVMPQEKEIEKKDE